MDILYEDERLIAINKPHGLIVHRSRIAMDVEDFALQRVRNYVGAYVHPIHRLDRKTSGVLLFAKDKDTHKAMHQLFMEKKIRKEYIAIVRGFTDKSGVIDYAVGEGDDKKEAITEYKTLRRYELNLPFGKWNTSRYSQLTIKPLTGRFHQIRKHLAHIRHPIIGDRPHGCNKQNRLWKEKFNMITMMLHAAKLELPYEGGNLVIEAEMSEEMRRVISLLEEKNII
ncbi:MAG: pseudouridylate synthase [Saprospiraceae bacterium]|nr:pseudouridylate synthase [Saprospiraceae bacterium]